MKGSKYLETQHNCASAEESKGSEANDSRPVAPTSAVMNSFDRLPLSHLLKQVGAGLDYLQFDYKAKRGVEDAGLFFLHSVTEHMDKKPGNYARKYCSWTLVVL